jgi:soluble lytic murein transglycosylase-like protein
MAIDRERLTTLLLLAGGGWMLYQYYLESNSATTGTLADALQTIGENAMTGLGVTDWRTVGEAATYMPYLNQAEAQFGIPTDLLARVAYQESHFRADIISGEVRSPAGAVGIMQLEPQFFPNAGQDPIADINTAAQDLSQLYGEFGDWQLAVAAYNDGPGNIKAVMAGTKVLPTETRNYVNQVFGDVPVAGSLVAVS